MEGLYQAPKDRLGEELVFFDQLFPGLSAPVVIRSQKVQKEGAQLHNLEVSCTADAHMSEASQDADVAVRDSQGHCHPTANVLWKPFLKIWPTVNCQKANPFTTDLMPRASDVHQS